MMIITCTVCPRDVFLWDLEYGGIFELPRPRVEVKQDFVLNFSPKFHRKTSRDKPKKRRIPSTQYHAVMNDHKRPHAETPHTPPATYAHPLMPEPDMETTARRVVTNGKQVGIRPFKRAKLDASDAGALARITVLYLERKGQRCVVVAACSWAVRCAPAVVGRGSRARVTGF